MAHRSLFVPNKAATTERELTALDASPHELLKEALEQMVTNFPPQDSYPTEPRTLRGICGGPTAMAYLFLHVSSAAGLADTGSGSGASSIPPLPGTVALANDEQLLVSGHPPLYWAGAYLAGSRADREFSVAPGGLFSECLSLAAVRAAVGKDLAEVHNLVRRAEEMLDPDEYPDELLFGRAGALYLLRMVRTWVPSSASLVEPLISRLSSLVLSRGGPDGSQWIWRGSRYLGAAHGVVGILTQLVLTTPSLAASDSRITATLDRLLALQQPSGNWTTRDSSTGMPLVQWCHGAPGFVPSLLSMRPFFPSRQSQIDAAVEKARDVVWKEGMLRKDPCLCHGLFGNALVLGSTARRDHFLAHATPSAVASARNDDATLFEPAEETGARFSLIMDYWPGAAWTWLLLSRKGDSNWARLVAYNDV